MSDIVWYGLFPLFGQLFRFSFVNTDRSTGSKKLIRKLEKPRRKEMSIDINDSSKKFNMK
jgi:hypothetical protein